MKALNINSIIKVKLTVKGIDIFYHQYDEINKKLKEFGCNAFEPCMPQIDEQGYTEFQLHEFMNLYGQYMVIGLQEVIKPLNIYIKDEDIKEIKEE